VDIESAKKELLHEQARRKHRQGARLSACCLLYLKRVCMRVLGLDWSLPGAVGDACRAWHARSEEHPFAEYEAFAAKIQELPSCESTQRSVHACTSVGHVLCQRAPCL
jgi:hypothetical protein